MNQTRIFNLSRVKGVVLCMRILSQWMIQHVKATGSLRSCPSIHATLAELLVQGLESWRDDGPNDDPLSLAAERN
jgi:hypothetical protein